jgi:hypothetical protein
MPGSVFGRLPKPRGMEVRDVSVAADGPGTRWGGFASEPS